MSLSRRAKLGGVLAVVLAAYALAGFTLVPRIARAQIEAFVAENLQRKIAIGEIQFNPFTLAATVTDLKLTEADGAPLIAFQRLHVNAELASLWRRGVVLKEIELTAPDIEAILAPDGSLNLARLAPPEDPPPEAGKADGEPLRLHIGRFAVTEGRVGFQDRSLAQPFSAAFTPIRFSLTEFRTDVGHRNVYSFAAASRIGSKFEWNGGFTVQPFGSSGTFSVTDVRLAALDEYLKDKLPIEIVSGALHLNGRYRFALRPLSLEVVLPSIGVRDLVLAERGVAAAAPVAVPHLDVQDLVFSLSRRDIGVRRVDVRGARLDVAREADGSISLARLAPASPATPPDAKPADKPWTVHVDALAVEAATVVAEDRTATPAARIQLAPVGFTLNGWTTTTAPGARMKIQSSIGIEGKGLLGVSGDLALEPLSAALAIELQGFPLPVLQPYVAQQAAATLQSGRLGVKGKLAFPAARFSGEVRIDDLVTTGEAREDLLKWRSLAITGIRFQQRPDRLLIDRIVAQEPYARLIIAENGTMNIASVLAPRADAPASPPPAGNPTPMPISIRSVEVAGGSAHFADHSVQPSFATGIVELGGKIAGLSSDPASRATVALAGKVDEYSPVDIAGEVNLLSAAVYTDLAVKFSNIELTTFNPYSGKFAGYNISKGKLSTSMKYQVANRKLDAQHHIVVDNLEFGDKTESKDAAPIPVKLGVALLKDRRGVIEIDLPIGGTLDDPEFRLGAIIGKALLNLLVKVISAPFKALGALFGGGEELAFVDFQPGIASLSDTEAKKLGTLAKALVERPALRLSLPLGVATGVDGEAMAREALRALVPPVDSGKPLNEAAKRKRVEALEVAYRTRQKAAPEYPAEAKGTEGTRLDAKIDWLNAALLEALKPAPAALEALGKQRAGSVRDTLLANKELEPARVFLVAKKPAEAPQPGLVRMDMELE